MNTFSKMNNINKEIIGLCVHFIGIKAIFIFYKF